MKYNDAGVHKSFKAFGKGAIIKYYQKKNKLSQY
jgi:hypothetical protein